MPEKIELSRAEVIAALKKAEGDATKAAKLLGVSRRTLYRIRDRDPKLLETWERHARGRHSPAQGAGVVKLNRARQKRGAPWPGCNPVTGEVRVIPEWAK